MSRRQFILVVNTILVLVVVSGMVIQKEWVAWTGQTIFLELAPVDPRSLIQGDYMILRYAIAREVSASTADGFIVVRLDQNHVAEYVGLYNAQTTLAPNELKIPYHQRSSDVYIGPESFFFQEGDAHYYNRAEYAELRLSSSGDLLLVGLRGENLEVLGPPESE